MVPEEPSQMQIGHNAKYQEQMHSPKQMCSMEIFEILNHLHIVDIHLTVQSPL